jgi:hypothetical protein
MTRKFSILLGAALIGFVAIIAFQQRSISGLRRQLAELTPALVVGPESPSAEATGQGSTDSSDRVAELNRENEALLRSLSTATNQISDYRQRLDEARSSATAISNQLTGVARLVRTNQLPRSDTFSPQDLRDVGTQTLDNALQTCLHAFCGTDPEALQRIAHPDSTLGKELFEQTREQLQGLSEVKASWQAENLDGSVDVTCELRYRDGTEGTPPTTLILHMRPFDGGWGLASFSHARVQLSKSSP